MIPKKIDIIPRKLNRLPFIGRKIQINECLVFLNSLKVDGSCRELIISGLSGVGKTYFCKHILHDFLNNNPDCFCLYEELVADDFITTTIFHSLLYSSLSSKKFNVDDPTNIPFELSFSKYIRNKSLEESTLNNIFSSIKNTTHLKIDENYLINAKTKGRPIMPHIGQPTLDINTLFMNYIKFITSKKPVIIVLDNYQFVPTQLRLFIETSFVTFKNNLCLVFLNRIQNSPTDLKKIRCFEKNSKIVNLKPFSLEETSILIEETISYSNKNEIENISKDSYLKSKGNLKELEYYIINLKNNKKINMPFVEIESFINTIGSLPTFQKFILAISVLFPKGLKIDYVVQILNNFLVYEQVDLIKDAINELIAIGYLMINSQNGKTLKFKHEKIKSVLNTINDDDFTEFQTVIVKTFEEFLSKRTKEYLYLLHCFIGIMSKGQIIQKIDYFIDLINMQYQNCNFQYISERYDIFLKIIDFLPEHTILTFLDSFQKTSEFTKGEVALKMLGNMEMNDYLWVYKAKYYTQTYKYKEGLKLLNKVDSKNISVEEIYLYKITILQYLLEDVEAKKIIDNVLCLDQKSPFYYIILRNSAHYFSFDEAISNLNTVLNYFIDQGSEFGKATSLNNLGVIYLWKKDTEKAFHVLTQAKSIMQGINSNEIFQPLWNLGVVEALNGNYKKSIEFFEDSCSWIHRNLSLDYILNRVNFNLAKLAINELPIADVFQELIDLLNMSKKINNPRMHAQITYNLLNLQDAFDLDELVTPTPKYFEYIDRISQKKTTGLEVYKEIKTQSKIINILFILSPHWRY